MGRQIVPVTWMESDHLIPLLNVLPFLSLVHTHMSYAATSSMACCRSASWRCRSAFRSPNGVKQSKGICKSRMGVGNSCIDIHWWGCDKMWWSLASSAAIASSTSLLWRSASTSNKSSSCAAVWHRPDQQWGPVEPPPFSLAPQPGIRRLWTQWLRIQWKTMHKVVGDWHDRHLVN